MKIKSIIIGLFLITAFGCEDILDRQPLDIITENQVWSDPNLVRAQLIALYARAPTRRMFHGGYSWENNPVFNDNHAEPHEEPGMYSVITDEARASYTWSPSRAINREGIRRNDPVQRYWDYGLIRACNELIENVSLGNINEAEKAALTAEARFIRAFVYFELVKRYGGVPLILEAQFLDDSQENLYPKRNTEKEVYDFIIAECQDIESKLLGKVAGNEGKANKFVALALLSRTALYAGSIAKYGTVALDGVVGINADPNTYFKISLDASEKILNEGGYDLYNKHTDKAVNYEQAFMDDTSPEVIFKRIYLGQTYGHSFNYFNVVQGFGAGWGSYMNPTLELVDAYEFIDGTDGKIDWENTTGSLDDLLANKDPRMHGTVMFHGNDYVNGEKLKMHFVEGDFSDGKGYNLLANRPNSFNKWKIDGDSVLIQNVGEDVYPVGQDKTKTGFFLRKLVDFNNIRATNWESQQDWIEFRLAEILLNKAEASMEMGNSGPAIEAVNRVRERAGIAALGSIDIDKIRHERRIELAFEAHRIWDMRRWRIAEAVMNKEFHGLQTIWRLPEDTYRHLVMNCDDREAFNKESFPRFFDARMYYLPIGEVLINNNPNLVENPGYL